MAKDRQIAPGTGEPMECHACGVSLSAVDYALQDGKWVRTSQTIDFAEIGSWGEAEASDWKPTPEH